MEQCNNALKDEDGMVNSEDPDQTAPDQNLQYLLRISEPII